MSLKFEELRILQAAEATADGIWKQVVQWDPFVRDVVGKQLARAADSIGAIIAAPSVVFIMERNYNSYIMHVAVFMKLSTGSTEL